MVYKSLGTFIDDLFAFVIKMPWMHRLSCLRDDFIFFIFLYQRWIYPVDKLRINEFGQVTEEFLADEKNKARVEKAPRQGVALGRQDASGRVRASSSATASASAPAAAIDAASAPLDVPTYAATLSCDCCSASRKPQCREKHRKPDDSTMSTGARTLAAGGTLAADVASAAADGTLAAAATAIAGRYRIVVGWL